MHDHNVVLVKYIPTFPSLINNMNCFCMISFFSTLHMHACFLTYKYTGPVKNRWITKRRRLSDRLYERWQSLVYSMLTLRSHPLFITFTVWTLQYSVFSNTIIKNMWQTQITHKIAQQVNKFQNVIIHNNTKNYIKSNNDLIIKDCLCKLLLQAGNIRSLSPWM